MGFDIGCSNLTPIIPLYIRDEEKTMFFWKQLFDAGVFTNAVLSPGVPPDQAMLRTSFMSLLSDEDLEQALEIIQKVGRQIGII
jgi:7-keto-8-aminopelargonate synthetase-like enzyme